MNSVVHTIACGLYGNAILSKDVDMVLRLLRELIEIQIVVSDNPRRMLRAGACAFSRLYHRLHESLFSAKLFLTSALHESAMRVLIEDDLMLDVDPLKAIANFSSAERLKRFGTEGTAEFDEKVTAYKQESMDKLFHLSKLCIQSLLDNWALFPSTLRWVVQTMCHLLKSAQIPTKEINHILTDMVFTNFICPAVVSPDLFGITDAPVSENARYNLIQIGQVIQVMALTKHEDIDAKFQQLFNMFDRNIVAELMEKLQETEYDVSVSMMAIPHQNDFGREHVLVTQTELNLFVDFLRSVLEHDGLSISGEDRRKLGNILDQLPDKWETLLNGSDPHQMSPPDAAASSGSRTKQSIINLGKSTKSRLAKTISLGVSGNHAHDDTLEFSDESAVLNHNNNNNGVDLDEFEPVLIIPIAINVESKFQLLTEQQVLNMNNISGSGDSETLKKIIDVGQEEDDGDEDDDEDDDDEELRKAANPVFGEVATGLRTRKHTRFSLSNDDQSIGNTSDNLEVVSEIPSNHSVTSSVEMEDNYQNINDNLSDMVSANVSGRGSPNISGRDTPLSQVTEGESPAIPSIHMAKILNKARSDINDKFCKFEINKLVEVDETVSIISDTWSTDVLASDSETLEAVDNERNFSTPLIPSSVTLPGDRNFVSINGAVMQLPANLLDASETRSESAWSTDVLASDSEKLIELDTDDNNSVTAMSDTTDTSRNELDILMRNGETSFLSPRSQNSNHFPTPPSNDSIFSNNRSFSSIPFNSASRFRHSSDEFTRYLSPISPLVQPSRESTAHQYSTAAGTLQRDTFSNTPKTIMRRQNSAESSISNQSSTNGEGAMARKKNKHEYRHSTTILRTNPNIMNPFAEKESAARKPLLPFNAADEQLVVVEQREVTLAQRSTSFDGRRNGMHSPKVMSSNYENHEIIFKAKENASTSITDDDKNRQKTQSLLIEKTMALSLAEQIDVVDVTDGPADNPSSDLAKSSNRYTGTIPKSISFDESANKRSGSYRNQLTNNDMPTGSPSNHPSGRPGFFNKLKPFFRNRRNNKARDGLTDECYGATGDGLVLRNATQTRTSDQAVGGAVEEDLLTGNDALFIDQSEDILAKYRRKISSSSEATNSDSLGHRKNSQTEVDSR